MRTLIVLAGLMISGLLAVTAAAQFNGKAPPGPPVNDADARPPRGWSGPPAAIHDRGDWRESGPARYDQWRNVVVGVRVERAGGALESDSGWAARTARPPTAGGGSARPWSTTARGR